MSWLERLPESFGPSHKMKLLTLFDTYLGATCGILRRTMHEPFPTVDGALLDSLLNLMDCEFYAFYPREGQENKSQEEIDQCANHMEAIFFFAFIWSVCCTVDLEGRHYMDVFMRQHMRMNSSQFQLPKEGSIYDYLYDTSRSPCGNQIELCETPTATPSRHGVFPHRSEQVGAVDGHGLALRARPGSVLC